MTRNFSIPAILASVLVAAGPAEPTRARLPPKPGGRFKCRHCGKPFQTHDGHDRHVANKHKRKG